MGDLRPAREGAARLEALRGWPPVMTALLPGIRKLVEVCAGVRAGERVVIAADFPKMDVAESIASVAATAGGVVVITAMAPLSLDGQEPPPAVAAALEGADVIFTPVTRSITHTQAMKRALERGARALSLSAIRPEMFIAGAMEADFEALRPAVRRVAELLTQAREAHLTSAGGTDLVADLTGRSGQAHSGIAREPGEFSTWPDIEASVSPIEGTARGRVVADASIPYYEIGVLEEPVVYDVDAGRITRISGGRQAQRIAALMADQGDDAVYSIAQLAFGLNPKARMCGWMLEDEGVYGTAHIGIGTSTLLGGTVVAPMHYDAIMWRPTLALDAIVVLRDGQWLAGEVTA